MSQPETDPTAPEAASTDASLREAVAEYLRLNMQQGVSGRWFTTLPLADFGAALTALLVGSEADRATAGEREAWFRGWEARAEYATRRDVPTEWPSLNPFPATAPADDTPDAIASEPLSERLTEAERDALTSAVDRAALVTTSKAAVTWGMPLLDILATEGHTHDCDAVASENLTLCDCWWRRVRTAAEALSQIATAADDALARGDGLDLPVAVERIVAARVAAAETKARAEGAAAERERIAAAITSSVSYGFGMNPDGTEDSQAMAYVEGLRDAAEIARGES